jgi:hypothetical protein
MPVVQRRGTSGKARRHRHRDTGHRAARDARRQPSRHLTVTTQQTSEKQPDDKEDDEPEEREIPSQVVPRE